MDEEKELKKYYDPSKEDLEIVKKVYDDFDVMIRERNKPRRLFNDRTLKEFVDDSSLRANSYVPTRESQGKDEWEPNFVHPVTRNKLKAILASVALDLPKTRIAAVNDKDEQDRMRADIIRNLVKFSYAKNNKEVDLFFEAWEMVEKGTSIVYDGFFRQSVEKNIITKYNPETGEVTTKKEKVTVGNKIESELVQLDNFYIYDFFIFGIQDQPAIAWIERMDEDSFENKYGNYKNSEYVCTHSPKMNPSEGALFFNERWTGRQDEEAPIEVIKYYSKTKDLYCIVANGVLLVSAPLLLGKVEKIYPFSKGIFEPLATNFFYGNSLPNSLLGEQDIINALYNSLVGKTFRSMSPGLIIGNANKDDFDLEDQDVSSDTRVYVQDVNQVREFPYSSVNNSEFSMLNLISRGLDLSSVDAAQQGIGGGGGTAREVVIANENAKKLKGILYLFLTDLWIQKINIRIQNILTFYLSPSMLKSFQGKKSNVNSFTVDNTELSDGQNGALGIDIYQNKKDLPTKDELDVAEMVFKRKSGMRYEKIAMSSDYLDDWRFDVKVVSESVFQQDSSLSQSKIDEKLRALSAFAPQVVMANQEKIAKDILTAYEDDADEYQFSMPNAQQAPVQQGNPIM